MTTEEQADDAAPPPEVTEELPSFPKRVFQVFFSPGDLTAALAKKPAWGAALFLGMVLMVAQTALIPAEVFDTMMRETLLQQGQEMPTNLAAGGSFMRIAGVVGGTIGFALMALLFAGVTTLIFAFIMGDEGRFTQYLAILTHAFLIPALIGFVLLPLKISQENPQLTVNLGSFFFFVPKGYLLKVLTMLDLSQMWAWLVIAQGAHAIAPRRSFASAATVLIILSVVLAMIFATFAPMPG